MQTSLSPIGGIHLSAAITDRRATITMYADNQPVRVTYAFEAGDEPAVDDPGSPDRATITAVQIGSIEIQDPGAVFSKAQLEEWTEQILLREMFR